MLCQVIGVQLKDRLQMKGGAFSTILSSETMRESQVKGYVTSFLFLLALLLLCSDLLRPLTLGLHFSSLS